MKAYYYLLSAIIVLLAVGSCGNRKEIKAPEKSGNLMTDQYNYAYCLMNENYDDVSEFLEEEGWKLNEIDTAWRMYFYEKSSDSIIVDLVFDLDDDSKVAYVGILLSDPHYGKDDHNSFLDDVEMLLAFIRHIGPTCKTKSGTVCECCGYHAYDGVDDIDGDDYEALLRDFTKVYGCRCFDTQWNDGVVKESVNFGAYNNMATHQIGVAISNNPEMLSVSPFR